jgi:hypothetical protein
MIKISDLVMNTRRVLASQHFENEDVLRTMTSLKGELGRLKDELRKISVGMLTT